jgi:signal transduction histidine kinase
MNQDHYSKARLLEELNKRLTTSKPLPLGEGSPTMEEEIRNLSLRLQQSEAGKSQFLSNVRNEINNPMASIIGLAASIFSHTGEDKVKQMSALIQKQATQLDFQIRNIIMAAEIELGEVRLSSSRVHVNSLIESQISYFHHTIAENSIEITLRVTDHLKFRTDSHMLQMICLNLVANAVEFCGAPKNVIVEARVINDQLEISVTDFGPGLDPSQQAEILQRFSQLESGICKKHKGHGLGLCIVNELTNQLGGTLTIESELGVGTRVTIRIPELVSDVDGPISSSNGNESLFTVDEEF